MDETLHPALLPDGLRDILPPDAEIEATHVERLMTVLGSHGYERVKPPLIEFEESLLGGPGSGMASDTFRLMDPISRRMIGVRADMTLQVARIATTRLVMSPRPLRLGYAGQVLRVHGTQIRPERQVGQVGGELIGSAAPAADAEVVTLAAEALTTIGVAGLSVDLTLPTLVPAVLAALDVPDRKVALLRSALDRKDAAAIAAIGGAAGDLLGRLLMAAGPAARALAALKAIDLPGEAAVARDRLVEVVALIQATAPALAMTIDPVENRGFEYHSGISFTVFARGIRGELGRGGRYFAGELMAEMGDGRTGAAAQPEPATGFTLYTDTVIKAAPKPIAGRRVLLPIEVSPAAARELRSAGWITVAALAAVADPVVEARRLGCGHVLLDGKLREL
ncbi:MAG TPA: ATP phosphoribosyltransferase regulatory subunit [Stellaceae bacterium]|nr:ATP phosphoribosyltransferase regulatory subunit [Stellaceae bacterium]